MNRAYNKGSRPKIAKKASIFYSDKTVHYYKNQSNFNQAKSTLQSVSEGWTMDVLG